MNMRMSQNYLLVFWVFVAVGCTCEPSIDKATGAPQPLKQKFFVGDFGILPASENNYTPLNALLRKVKVLPGGAEIVFARNAVYRIALPDGKDMREKYALHIKGATNLVLNGQGATLLITNPEHGGICTDNSVGIEVRHFVIDYDPLPYTQGIIQAVNREESWFELKVDNGFLQPDQPCFERARGTGGITIRDTADGGRKYGPIPLFCKQREKAGNRIWRFFTDENRNKVSSAGLKAGDRYIHMARNYSAALAARSCDQVLWEDITVLSSPGLAFYPTRSAHHTIRNCHTKVKAGRFFSTNADGIHMRGSRGNALIEGCSFEGMADDAINVHSSAMGVQAQPAANQVEVSKGSFTVRVGDQVVAVDAASAAIIGAAVIEKIEDRGSSWLLSLDREFAPFNTEDSAGLDAHGAPIVSVNFYNLSESANPFVIRNCEFKDYRGRGILVSAHGGLIENNTFRVREGWGVVMHYETSRWVEGPIAHDIVIRNNQFFAMPSSYTQPAILSQIQTRAGVAVDGNPFRNISIENNRFYGYPSPAIRMKYTAGLQLKNNEEIPATE